MEITTSTSNGVATLSVSGQIVYPGHRDVRTAAQTAIGSAAVKELQVDLAGVEYLDSNALGMLLMVRYDASAVGKSVSLSGARGKVKEVLDMTNFSKLFALK